MTASSDEPKVHRIRLKGPWEISPPGIQGEDYQRHSMPQDWRSVFNDTSGTAIFRRNFHSPSGLEAGDRVLIHVPAGVGELTSFSINGIEIKAAEVDPLKFDVTGYLIEFNLLQFSLTFDPQKQPDIPGGLWETVFLEIHSA